MGTVIDRIELAHPRLRGRHSALHLAVTAAKDCLQRAGCDASELDLVVNAGIYRDRNIGEPALAALIQDDIGANPEDPHAGAHGTFSFDIANGACGVLTALQIVDGFLRTHSINRALIVASDADPGHGMSEHFPFSAAGAALLCGWTDDGYGLSRVSWVNTNGEDSEAFTATVGFKDARNILRLTELPDRDERFAGAAAEAARACLDAQSTRLEDIDLIVVAPARPGYRAALSHLLGVPVEKICVADDHRMHTAALAAAFEPEVGRLPAGARVLFLAAGAGVTAGAAVYRQPPRAGSESGHLQQTTTSR
jgi:3-oxoacyl-[acyl-carrier-protein] synthase III